MERAALPLGAAPGFGEPAFSWLDELIDFAARRWRPILACLVATLGLAVLYLLVATPRYTASTTLLIDTRRADLFQQQPAVADAQIMNAFVESQVEVLRSEGLARIVVRRLDLARDPAFQSRPSVMQRLAQGLRRTVSRVRLASPDADRTEALARTLLAMSSIRRVGLTYVIEIDVTAPTQAAAARIANGIATSYVAEQLAAKEDSTREAVAWLQVRLRELGRQALDADRQVQAYKAREGIVDTGRGLLNEQQLGELQSSETVTRARMVDAKARLDRIEAALAGPDGTSGSVPDVLQNPVINTLEAKYLDDARLEAEWSARYGRDHAATRKLRQDMDAVAVSIHEEMERMAEAARSTYQVAATDEAAARSQLERLVGRAEATNTSRAVLRSLQSQADTYRQLYATFLQRYTQAAQDESFPVSEVRVVTPALPPLTKSRPRTTLVLAAALVLGLVAGAGAALLLDLLDHAPRTPRDVELRLGLPCLAALPQIEGRQTDHAGREMAPGSQADPDPGADPSSLFAQGIRRLRLRLERWAPRDRALVLGLLAPSPGQGTSTVARHLAPAMAAAGRRVALVELRDTGEVSARLMTPGGEEHHPAGALLGASLRPAEALQTLRGRADIVFLDLPPLAPVVDQHALLDSVDGLILVLQWGRGDDRAIRGQLAAAGLDPRRLLGAVLQRTRSGLRGLTAA